MEPNWFGLTMVLGFIAAGTLVFVLTYKLLAAVSRRLFSTKFKEIPTSENVTPHSLVAILVVLLVILVLPVYVLTSMPNTQLNGLHVAVWWAIWALLHSPKKDFFHLMDTRLRGGALRSVVAKIGVRFDRPLVAESSRPLGE